ncbi:MAG: hypothetical protein LBG17_00620 [Bacteroidales bacterium]|jgi:D-alanyl-lipoteichoic acid acyltransferase DltB (MBOAT superfamily)|nr:hypothetical protein [Bacteroidales bacterium]
MNTFLFTDISFWGFFAFVLLGLSFFYNRLPIRNGFLFLCSAVFYFLIGGLSVLLILLFSIIINYLCGLIRHWFSVTLAITINILVYTIFLIQEFPQTALGSALPLLSVLPFGISFYTFSAISYNVDVYKRRIKPVRNFIDFGLYLSFFPTAAAGPVLRATDFIPQLHKYYQVTSREFSIALYSILGGLVKIAVADFIALNFNLENWLAIYGSAIRIYCIFSGYTGVAVGIAMLLGFKIPVNFNSPYKAASLTDFCNRWYISFFTWLRDYVYIPLGGKQRSTRNEQQGAGSNFLIRFAGLLITFHFICFMWIILRADTFDKAVLTIQQFFTPTWRMVTLAEIKDNVAALSLIAAMLIIHLLPVRAKDFCREIFYSLPIVVKFLAALAVAAVVYFLV